jgi:hypothetical protein
MASMAMRAWYMQGHVYISGTLIAILDHGNVMIKPDWGSIKSVGWNIAKEGVMETGSRLNRQCPRNQHPEY